MEIERFFIGCITLPIIGSLLISNVWEIIVCLHDIVHFLSDSVTNCVHQYYYNMIIYSAVINLLFSAYFFKRRYEVINVYENMIKEYYHRKEQIHLLINMMMLQSASAFFDSTIYESIKSRYDQNNCNQINDSYFIVHEMYHNINIVVMYIYFGAFVMIIGVFFSAFTIILFDHINNESYTTITNPIHRIGYIVRGTIAQMDQIINQHF